MAQLKQELAIKDKALEGIAIKCREQLEENQALRGELESRLVELLIPNCLDYFQYGKNILTEIGVTNTSDDNALTLMGRLEHAPGRVVDWKETYARGGATTAFAFVAAHHPAAEILKITKSMQKVDDDGKEIDTAAVWRPVVTYGYRVASVVDLKRFLKDVPLPRKAA
ncbi:hypothetical protein ACQ4PT_061324 [Festuca glaucescens]